MKDINTVWLENHYNDIPTEHLFSFLNLYNLINDPKTQRDTELIYKSVKFFILIIHGSNCKFKDKNLVFDGIYAQLKKKKQRRQALKCINYYFRIWIADKLQHNDIHQYTEWEVIKISPSKITVKE